MIGEYAFGATASVGAATSYTPDMDIDALFRRADAALYHAKHEGRICRRGRAPAAPGCRSIATQRHGGQAGVFAQRKVHARRTNSARPATMGTTATSRLPSAR
jgi:GGDEF domain-containing protein